MPWKNHSPSPGEEPAHYRPPALTDAIVLGAEYLQDYARSKRKEAGQIRESLLATQKLFGKDDRDNARLLRDMAADYMGMYRGWDGAVKYLEGDPKLTDHYCPAIQEEVAVYLDRAFNELTIVEQPINGANDE